MNVELSWRAVAIIIALAVLGVVCSILGEKTLGGSLVGGALGYLAQGFGSGKRVDGAGVPLELASVESSKRFAVGGGPVPPTPPALAARFKVLELAGALGLVYTALMLGGR